MNSSVIPIIIAAATPVARKVFETISEISESNSSEVLKFKCLHAIQGRRRYQSDLLKNKEFSDKLQKKIESLNLVDKVTVNNVTGSLLLEYTCKEAEIDRMIDALNEEQNKFNHSAFDKARNIIEKIAKTAISKESSHTDSSMQKRPRRGSRGTGAGNNVKKNIIPSDYDKEELISTLVGAICLIWGSFQVVGKGHVPVAPHLTWGLYKLVSMITSDKK